MKERCEGSCEGARKKAPVFPGPPPPPLPPQPPVTCAWPLCVVFASLPKRILKRFSDVPWIGNMTENDFTWFYFQKVVANQLSAKVALTPFHKLPKDISISFLTSRFFTPFFFCSLNFLRLKAITKEVV